MAADGAPAAARFAQPAEVTLVRGILRPWVASGAHPVRDAASGVYVHKVDFYSASPDVLAERYRATVSQDGDQAWYFLTNLRPKAHVGKRKSRTISGGPTPTWWQGEGATKQVHDAIDANRLVGQRKMFAYMSKDSGGGPDVRLGLMLAEFCVVIETANDASPGRVIDKYALGKMYRSKRQRQDGAPAAKKAATAAADMEGAPAAKKAATAAADAEGAPAAKKAATAAADAEGARAAKKPAMAAADAEGAPAAKKPATAAADAEGAPPAKKPATAAADAEGAPPAKKPATAAADAEGAPPAKKAATATAASVPAAGKGAGAPAAHYCPQCGFCIGSLETVMTPSAPREIH